jgi:DNA modification methylase
MYEKNAAVLTDSYELIHGNSLEIIKKIPNSSVKCVVTSTPYWGMRIYQEPRFNLWSDGEFCPYGHEQTPEGFLRHTTEVLAVLFDVLAEDGSIWWNVMDTFNTRTQIRGNAAEALRAMQGKDDRSWGDHDCRRYSAGHSYLKDGEQCVIPALIAERASRIGYYVKSVITWAKTSTLPEPQESRVSRNLEYVLHLTKNRTPIFNKESYRRVPASLGGRNNGAETDKLSDVWTLPTSSGRDGHGAQFPIALPARCIAISTNEGDLVLDPFVGAGNSGVAARALGRKFIGIDVCEEYLATANRKISAAHPLLQDIEVNQTALPNQTEKLL